MRIQCNNVVNQKKQLSLLFNHEREIMIAVCYNSNKGNKKLKKLLTQLQVMDTDHLKSLVSKYYYMCSNHYHLKWFLRKLYRQKMSLLAICAKTTEANSCIERLISNIGKALYDLYRETSFEPVLHPSQKIAQTQSESNENDLFSEILYF